MTKQTFPSVRLINKKSHIYPQTSFISRSQRNQREGHKSGVIWLTGLSGAGKSTIAKAVEKKLFEKGFLVTMLDGDCLRTGLNSDLDFSTKSREENLRRAGEVASILSTQGHIVLATFISPHIIGRNVVANIVKNDFHLVYVKASIDDCIKRDPKGLYKKAINGAIDNFTGVGQSYEEPTSTNLILDTSENDINTCSSALMNYINHNFKPLPVKTP